MDETPRIITYNGTDINELTREELVEALKTAIDTIKWYQKLQHLTSERNELQAKIREREFTISQLEAYQSEMDKLASKLGYYGEMMKYSEWRKEVMQNPKFVEAYNRLRFRLWLSNLLIRFRIFCRDLWDISGKE